MLQIRDGELPEISPKDDISIDAPPPAQAEDGLPVPRRYIAIAAISFGNALLVIDGSIPNVALPTIARDLGVSEGVVTNVVTVYQMVMVMGLLPFASLGDRIGHRKLYQLGQLIFLLASALCAFVHDFASLLLLRAGQALGAGMALSVAVAMLRETYPAKSLGGGLGFNSVIIASSGAIAPTLGGFLVANFPWQSVFVAAAPLAVISLILGRTLPDPHPKQDPPDLTGGAWSALTVGLLIGGLQLATHAASHWPGVILAVGGIVSAVLLVRRESKRVRPVVPVDLLAMPVIGLSALAAMAVFCATAALMLSLPFMLEQARGYAPDEVGMLLLPFPLTMLVVSPLAGWLSDHVAPTKLGVPGLVVGITGLLLLAFLPEGVGPTGIAWRLSMTAAGFGFFLAPNSRLLIGNAPMDRSAAAGSALSTSRLLGQTMAATLVGVLLSLGLGIGPVPMLVAMALAVLAMACSMVRFRTVRAKRLAQHAVEPGL
jgi:DHA2 family multidrug resistance protein-like MFS transporter